MAASTTASLAFDHAAGLLKLRVLADLLDVLLHRLLEVGILHHRPHARLSRRVLQLLERLPEHEVWWVWCAG